MSERDNRAGSRWLDRLTVELESADFGIVCLTPDNIEGRWINFESGALGRSVERGRLIPLLYNLESSEVQLPLSQFMMKRLNKDGIRDIVGALNASLDSNNRISEGRLDGVFTALWPNLVAKLDDAAESNLNETSTERSNRALLEQILALMQELTTSLFKQTPDRSVEVSHEPASKICVLRSIWTIAELCDLAGRVLSSNVQTSAVEIDLPATRPVPVSGPQAPHGPGTIAVLLEGEPGDVLKRSTRISDVLGGDASTHPDLPTWCGRHPFGPNEVGLQITVPSAHLHNAIYALHDVAAAPVPIRGSASTGVIHASLPSSTRPDRIAVMVDALRSVLIARDGSCVIVSAPPTTPDAVNL